jgi:DNA (cytosine-5)-methyltransferase 1
MAKKVTAIDLFCGAGGLSLGFERAGFDVISAVDKEPSAVQTHRKNLVGAVEELDLSTDVVLPQATVIAGGPPCQGFSSAGLRKHGDERNSLVSVFAQLIVSVRPSAFVFENVEGFLTAEKGRRVLELLRPLVAAGYRIHLRKINAANYGVPQHRKRVVAIGGLGFDPTFPAPTHTAFGAPGALLAAKHLPPAPTIAEALSGLPVPTTEPNGFPSGHWFRPLEGIDLTRAKMLKQGQTMRDLPAELHHESYVRRANRRVQDGTASERRGGAPAGIRRLDEKAPSKAITGGARGEFIHPTEDRNLTIRECARLQTFPDEFEFVGTVAEQMQLIGNAVPPRLAEVIGRTLKKDLAKAHLGQRPGALLSFVPSLADGFSPVLRSITDQVEREFFQTAVQAQELSLWG